MMSSGNGLGPVLTLEKVSKRYGGVKALDNLDLSVVDGELRCLIGPNGAGKSTVFRMVMGVEPPTSGTIRLNGTVINRWPTWKRARQGLSIKMQIPGVYPDLTVRDNMRVAAQHHIPGARMGVEIDDLLTRVGLEHLGDEMTRNLSHGQQQWLEIGMALSARPQVLLLDEPTAGMGPIETETTARLVQSLNEQGMTIIVIDHDMAFVRRIARTVTVLHLGRLFAQGTIDEIEANDDVTAIYLGRA
jgi:branched-chain amino acid transport system ATP-binding protein